MNETKQQTQHTLNTKFFTQGNTVSAISFNENTTSNNLKAMLYTVSYNDIQGFYLTMLKDKMEVPNKIFGNVKKRAQKVINTYNDRETSTGILLTGIKGGGKTMLSSLICNEMIDKGIPILIITEPYSGDGFNRFIETIGNCVLFIDEFGKVYKNSKDEEDNTNQDSLLTLMDGISKQKRLVILTENDEADINEFMLNRPSRLYYHFKYDKLDEKSIKDYCKYKKLSKEVKKEIVSVSRQIMDFSFDILQTIIEEYLRYNDSIESIVEDLNIEVKKSRAIFKVKNITRLRDNHKMFVKTDYEYVDISFKKYEGVYIQIQEEEKSDNTSYIDFDARECLKYENGNNFLFETDKYKIEIERIELGNIF